MAKISEQWFDGKRFSKFTGNNYFWNKRRVAGRQRSTSMHRYVWEYYNGPIPDMRVVHHKDNNPDNNDIGNLELRERGEHQREHMAVRVANGYAGEHGLVKAREAAREWHGSIEGRAWHSAHAKQAWTNRDRITENCAHCGKPYEVLRGAKKRGFCSPACQSSARRASGVDNAPRGCAVCGTKFICNKYSKVKTCSDACWKAQIAATRRSLYLAGEKRGDVLC